MNDRRKEIRKERKEYDKTSTPVSIYPLNAHQNNA